MRDAAEIRDLINLSDLAGGHFFKTYEGSLLGDTVFIFDLQNTGGTVAGTSTGGLAAH